MGIYTSRQLESETPPMTAKLIHQDGRLQEFDYPIKVSNVIDHHSRVTFICNSDEMEFGEVASPVLNDSELQLGQLYFVLPISRLSQPLLAEEMAALAVKAHAALMRNSGGKCECMSKMGPAVFYVDGEWEKDRGKCGGWKKGITGRKNGGGSRRKVFAANLSTIEE